MPTAEWARKHPDRMRAARRRWYENNREHAINEVARRKKELTQWFNEYKKSLKCSRCSESHPSCLEFHHINPEEKDIDVSAAAGNGWGKERIMDEVAKCIVLCANCHRKEHDNQ